MPLQEPPIDDRTFEQILAELQLRIPRYTKDWTNFNDSDPGMTLVQLFAWLSEQMRWRMNLVPRKNYIKFLKLLGEDLQHATPATAHLTFVPKGNTLAEPVPARTQITAQVDDGGTPLVFETERGLDLISPLLDTLGTFNGASFTDVTHANETPGTKFKPFGAAPAAGNALYLGFAPNDSLPKDKALFPQTMSFRVFLPAEKTAGRPRPCDGTTPPPVAPVTLIWEYKPTASAPWSRLNVLEDETAAFTREGYIRVQGPRAIEPVQETRLNDKPRFWIRVRLDSGRNYPAGRAPEIDFLRPNTVEATNLNTVSGEVLGSSEGHPSEEFPTQNKPVSSLQLQVQPVAGDSEIWKPVDDFLSSLPDDPHYQLNATTGVVKFGNGDRGRIPEAGSQIVALEYRAGGGKRGNNAGPGTINAPRTTLVGVDKVTNERKAVGGADEQSLEDMMLTGPTILRRRNRAVTDEDFQYIAEQIGGVAHAAALPLFHPDHRDVSVPGALTVVIVPDNDDTPPKPTVDLIEAVCKALDGVRLLTTEVFVKGPEYQEIKVEVRVAANPYASFDQVTADVLNALDTLLDPRTERFGNDFEPTRIFGAILGVKDVRGVPSMNVYVNGRLHPGLDSIAVPPDGLLFGRDHFIAVEPETNK